MIRPIASDEASELVSLLASAGLPVEDLEAADWLLLLGCFEGGRLVAAGGLERCGDTLLLRSVVTAPDCRGRGLSGELVGRLHASARDSGYDRTWLLTETARTYFRLCHDYAAVGRDEAPEAIRSSREFGHLCSDGAALMVRHL